MQKTNASRIDAPNPNDIAPGITSHRIMMVNVFFVANSDREWVLIDAGLYFSADRIRRAAEERFGQGSRPKAILLTHGHFDHVGSLKTLADEWDVPIYAHRLELPYVTGRSAYPPPDPAVGKGAFTWMAPMYPRGPIDVSDRIRTLPEDGSVPHLPGWRWIHTPGHTNGHVSFFRDEDRALVAGDAITTTQQESITGVVTQKLEVHGPVAYYTSDWDAARESVQRLAKLHPQLLACGHGTPMSGESAAGLLRISRTFDRTERPKRGRYITRPAIADETGVVWVPPAVVTPGMKIAAGVAVGVAAVGLISLLRRRA